MAIGANEKLVACPKRAPIDRLNKILAAFILLHKCAEKRLNFNFTVTLGTGVGSAVARERLLSAPGGLGIKSNFQTAPQ